MKASACDECGVPEIFSAGQAWLNNGDIVQRINEKARMGFIECENLDPLFKNIGDLIGFPVEELIINSTARGSAIYLERLIPEEVKTLFRNGDMGADVFIKSISNYCHALGYGKYENAAFRYEGDTGDFYRQRIFRPFSLPEAAGCLAGALAAIVGGEHSVTYEEVSPALYEFTTGWTEYPESLKEKLRISEYTHRDGDLELERCGSCGCPREFSAFRWEFDQGLIVNEHTGRRMAILGTELLDNVFEALESELGETIPTVVIEAQRLFTKTGFYSIEQVSNEDEFRSQLALRGLGNLRMIKMGTRGLRMRIDNVAGYLLTVGMAQGLFEMALDEDSHVDWELSKQGDLLVEVTPAGAAHPRS